MSNQVTIAGNLTRDPELRYTPSGTALAKMGVAVNRVWTGRDGKKEEEVSYFNIVAWAGLAENCAESLTVGTRVVVSGRLQSRSWETEEGEKRTVVEITADEVGPSLRWATAAVTKTTRSGPGDWPGEEATG